MSVYEASINNPKKQLEFYKDLSEQLEKENARLKDKIEKATKYIEWQRDNPQYDNIWRNYECNELLKILKEN